MTDVIDNISANRHSNYWSYHKIGSLFPILSFKKYFESSQHPKYFFKDKVGNRLTKNVVTFLLKFLF